METKKFSANCHFLRLIRLKSSWFFIASVFELENDSGYDIS